MNLFDVLTKKARRAMAITMSLALTAPVLAIDCQARRAYSSVAGNVHRPIEVAPYAGGRKAGPVFDWSNLVKLESDTEARADLIKKAAEGNVDKVFVLGCMFLYGKGVEKSAYKAFENYRFAAQKGDARAQNNLGYFYLEGIGVKKDIKQALSWFKLSADAKNSYGIANLAYMQEHGLGIAPNKEEAKKLYEMAASLGNKTAHQNLLMMKFEAARKLSPVKIVNATPETAVAAAKSPAKPAKEDSPQAQEKSEPAPEEQAKAQAPEKTDSLSAGSPTLTAILNRLSKDTDLAPPEEPKSETTKEPEPEPEPEKKQEEISEQAKGEPAAIAETKPEAETKLAVAETTEPTASAVEVEEATKEEKQEEKKDESKVEALAEVAVAPPPVQEQQPVIQKPDPLSTPVTLTKKEDKVAPEPESKESVAEKPQTVESRKPIRDKWALVVGITDFQNPKIPNLRYSSKDATDFYNYLIKEGNFEPDHVRLLLNEKATQRKVLSELGSKFLARVVKPDDLVVLYFSTHGSPASLDPRGRNYLVAHDSDPEDLFATGIEMQKLLDSIQGRVLTDRVLLVLDACHSGFVDPQSKGIARTANFNVNDMFQGSGQLVICSSAPDQRAWESTRYRNGVFTKRFLEGLKKQGETTPLVEAFDFAKDRVQDEVQEDRPGAVQTPVLKGKWSGKELVISTPAAAPQKVPTSVVADLGPDSRVDLLAMKPAETLQPKAVLPQTSESSNESTVKPVVSAEEKQGIVYLDSQFFSVNGDPKHLVREYHDAIRSNPSDSKYYYLKAKALIQLSDWHNAMLCLNDAIQLSPNRATYYLARAYVYCKSGKRVLGEQDLGQARLYDPRHGNIRLPD
ncbi:MAG: caspase family protein [Candidatus Obscuribacterales bacterium]|nr:caspase family protein [Candidatus Obscuribacterales bacterium]